MNFYPPPEVVTALVYYDVPESLRCRARSTEWSRGFYHGLDGVFLEGPCFDNDGDLYVVDVAFGRIVKINQAKQGSVALEWDGEPNGLALMPNGRIMVADYKQGLLEFDPRQQTITPRLTRCHLERFKGLNDLIVDSKNNIYFTDQGQTSMMDQTGKVYRLSADGRLDCLIGNGISPNGLVLSVDEKTLYVAMTRSNQVWQLPLYSDGTTGKAQVFFQAFGPVGPDGLAMDQEGNLFICVPGLGRVFVVDRKGIPLKSIQGPHADTFITNCTFGGSDNKTLFLTDSLNGSILKLDWHCRGM